MSQMKRLLAQVRATGSQATIFAGFIFYNIVTFQTDIQDLPFYNKGAGWLFLVINSVTFCLGIIVVIFATFVSVAANLHTTDSIKAAFCHRVRYFGPGCASLYLLGLVAFNASYTMYGYAKFSEPKTQPFWTSCILDLGILVMILFAVRKYRQARWAVKNRPASSARSKQRVRSDDTVGLLSSPVEEGEEGGEEEDAQAPAPSRKLSKMLDTLSVRALFFAGFAYFSVDFFYMPTSQFADFYLTVMSISFACGLAIVVENVIIQMAMEFLKSEAEVEEFLKGVEPMISFSFWLAGASVLSFFVGLCLIGRIKKYYVYTTHVIRYTWVFHAAGALGFLLIAFVMWWVWSRLRRVQRAEREGVPFDVAQEYFNYTRMLAEGDALSAQASFVAGNVFYEILFSDKGDVEWANYWYFSLACVTLVLGSLVVVLSLAIGVAVTSLTSESARMRFGRLLNPSAAMFSLFNLSQYAWLLDLAAMGYVKYKNRWQISFIWGTFGLLCVSFFWAIINRRWKSCYYSIPPVRTSP